ncbi:hypothetical protein [Streptomyces sp. NPDC050164]|uniref:hypothetical protein n=1 Tax=Streptomyces sp. NPDC050164 TaxID=3365605 RepID=UPI0037B2C7F1
MTDESDAAPQRRPRKVRHGRVRSPGQRSPRISSKAIRSARAAQDAAHGTSHTSQVDSSQADSREELRGDRYRYTLLAICMLAFVRVALSMATRRIQGEALLPLPTWEWSAAALTPLLVLLRFRAPALRGRVFQLESHLRFFSGFYLVYALPFALLDGRWQLWPAVIFSVSVFIGIWYTNKQSADHG